jgi:hypothetical protein
MNKLLMKSLAVVTLAVSMSAASAYANDEHVKLTFSGTSGNSAMNLLQPNASNDEDQFAGDGTLGSFTLRNLRAISNAPGSSPTCTGSNKLFLPESAGAGVFRFSDGSLLQLTLTEGGDCIDLSTGVANCVLTFKITGGTGRFKNASGELTMTETVLGVIADTTGNPVFFTATGDFTGTIHGVTKSQCDGD